MCSDAGGVSTVSHLKEFRFITGSKIAYENEKRREDILGYHQYLELTEVTTALVQRVQPSFGSNLESNRL
jgi:hypothetical protein